MGDAGVVAGRRHAVMGAERLVAERQILLGVGIEIAERGRQAVATMFVRHAAERPQRILQALCQSDEALAAKNNMGMLKARECQPEVVKPMASGTPTIVMPSAFVSVKSDRPRRPGSWSCRKITSCSGQTTPANPACAVPACAGCQG